MKIGIMGGTFDPIHLGHLEMAEYCLKNCGLDKIMFLPLGDAPHKKNITKKELRIKMIEESIKAYPDFFISLLECDRIGKTYTFDTLTELKKRSDDEFFFIIGGDTVLTLDSWYRAADVFKMIKFIVIERENDEIALKLKTLEKKGARFIKTKHIGLNVSSTEIRSRVLNGLSLEGLVTPQAEEIINEFKLYQN